VSHNMAAIKQLCTKGVYLIKGGVACDGAARDVIQNYLGGAGASASQVDVPAEAHADTWGGTSRIEVKRIRHLDDEFGNFRIRWKCPIRFEVEFEVKEDLRHVEFGLGVSDTQGVMIFGSHHIDDGSAVRSFAPGWYRMVVRLDNPLRAGLYQLEIGAVAAIGTAPIFLVPDALRFEVLDIGVDDKMHPQYGRCLINGSGTWSEAVPVRTV